MNTLTTPSVLTPTTVLPVKPKPLEIQFLLLNDTAKPPIRAHQHDAGFNLYANRAIHPPDADPLDHVFGTGVAVLIPPGYVGIVAARSSIRNTRYLLANGVGIVDAGYTGEIQVSLRELPRTSRVYQLGDHIAQLIVMPLPEVTYTLVSEFPPTSRGANGHGSTGV
jgi:dUTP pyrophosphatase